MEEPLLRVLARFADEVGRRLETGAVPTRGELGDILGAAQSAEASEVREDEPGADQREYRGEIRVHRRPPGGRNAPVTQHAGDLGNELLSLQRLADQGFRCVTVYLTDEVMAGYLSNPGNGLKRLYDLRPGDACLVTREFLGGRAQSFRGRLKGTLQDIHVRGLVRRDYPRGYGLRVWEIVSRNAPATALPNEDHRVADVVSAPRHLGDLVPPVSASVGPTGLDRDSDVVLLGCVKEKRATRSPAKDLYVSDLFGKRRAYAEASGKLWFILSAKLGLVDPDEEIDPYDLRLDDLSAFEREQWGRRVVSDLADKLGSLDGLVFEVHAGAAYREAIAAPLSLAGAGLVNPLQGLRFGEQLSWYGRQPSVPAADHPERPAVTTGPTSRADSPQALSRVLTAAFQSGGLDLSSRPGAPTPGWAGMPEVVFADRLRELGADGARIRTGLTLVMALDRARDADRLWSAAAALYADRPDLFDPGALSGLAADEVGDALRASGVSQRHGPDTEAWLRVARSLADAELAPAVHWAVLDGAGSVSDLLREKHKAAPDGTALFPMLRGPKIGPVWVRILAYPGGAALDGLEELPVGVDVQVRKVTEYLGLTTTQGWPLEEARPVIQAAWRKQVDEFGADAAGPLKDTCAALDPALWFFGKWGCTFCERAGRRLPVHAACAGCNYQLTGAQAGSVVPEAKSDLSDSVFAALPTQTQSRLTRLSAAVAGVQPDSIRSWQVDIATLSEEGEVSSLVREVSEWAGAGVPCLYYLDCRSAGVDLAEVESAFSTGRAEQDRAYPRLNAPGTCFYVGSSRSLATRLKEHLGYGARGTYALQLTHWATALPLQLDFVCARYAKDTSAVVVQALEDTLWEARQPMFGRRGAK